MYKDTAEIFLPWGGDERQALKRTTHLAIAAHQDDVEIMACDGIFKCFNSDTQFFTAVIITDGAGSARSGAYAHYTDQQMMQVRRTEQKKAAVVGNYNALILLDYSSSEVKDPTENNLIADLTHLISQMSVDTVYIHNLADKHDTHVGCALKSIEALRQCPAKPKRLYGCEVWRGLDWLVDSDKVALDVSAPDNISTSLISIFDSQISGGKRYDKAAQGRRTANATYHASHSVDSTTQLDFAMDLTPLLTTNTTPQDYIQPYLTRFTTDIQSRLTTLAPKKP